MADFEVPRPQHAPVRPQRRAATAASEHIIANGAALATFKVEELTNWAATSHGLARRLKRNMACEGRALSRHSAMPEVWAVKSCQVVPGGLLGGLGPAEEPWLID